LLVVVVREVGEFLFQLAEAMLDSYTIVGERTEFGRGPLVQKYLHMVRG